MTAVEASEIASIIFTFCKDDCVFCRRCHMSSKSHLLVRRARSLPIPATQVDPLPNSYYDEIVGLWMSTESHLPLIYDPNRPRPKTKKEDVETGEDQKGT
jgi:hypothetical protein